MEQVNISFGTSNAAFWDNNGPEETARILVNIAGRIKDGHDSGIIHDSNGNNIGHWWADFPNSED